MRCCSVCSGGVLDGGSLETGAESKCRRGGSDGRGSGNEVEAVSSSRGLRFVVSISIALWIAVVGDGVLRVEALVQTMSCWRTGSGGREHNANRDVQLEWTASSPRAASHLAVFPRFS